eukprot:8795696-Lingulodinium_polyedra.AAC.1
MGISPSASEVEEEEEGPQEADPYLTPSEPPVAGDAHHPQQTARQRTLFELPRPPRRRLPLEGERRPIQT